MKVRFNAVDEFLAELSQDASLVEHDILRVTWQYQLTKMEPIRHLYVVAGAIIRGQIVELRHFCGQVFDLPYEDEANKKTEERAEGLMARITAEAARLGLDVRAGVFEG